MIHNLPVNGILSNIITGDDRRFNFGFREGVMKQDKAIGIDIGGTNTKIGVLDSDGNLCGYSSIPTDSHTGFSDFLDRVEKELIKHCGGSNGIKSMLGIGVGAPNANPLSGLVIEPPNLDWGTVAIKNEFENRFGLPVYLDNDANVAAQGEGLWGVAAGMKNFIVVTLGTGVGTGIIVDGDLVVGSTGTAGEGGHLTIVPQGRDCNCGGKGHLESYASAGGIEKTSLEIFGKKLTSKEVGELFQKGDQQAQKVIELTADYLGRGLALMGTLFAPEAFVLAGGVASLGSPFDKMVEEQLDVYIFPSMRGKIKVLFSSISQSEGAILGAASLVFKHHS